MKKVVALLTKKRKFPHNYGTEVTNFLIENIHKHYAQDFQGDWFLKV